MDNEARGRILVIDDELGPRESIRLLFKPEYEVLCCESVDQGVAALLAFGPDVVIMDITMPGKNGIVGLREIRGLDTSVAVLMLTGFGTLETAQEAIQLGANAYLKKPFETRDMRTLVRSHVEQSRLRRRKSETFRQLEAINRQLTEELSARENMASLGQASSELVHDLRNALSVISGYVHILLQDLGQKEFDRTNTQEALDYLSIIARNAERCQDMSRVWKDLSQPGRPLQLEVCSIPAVLSDIVGGYQAIQRSSGVTVSLAPGPEPCLVAANKTHLFRALQNLIHNAVQAVPRQTGQVHVGWDVRDDGVEVRVCDNGPGLPPGREDVFKPFVTTKQGLGGMGIGLFITRKIVERHGGKVTLANLSGGGAQATVVLPRHRPS